jgi:hypothetical protein
VFSELKTLRKMHEWERSKNQSRFLYILSPRILFLISSPFPSSSSVSSSFSSSTFLSNLHFFPPFTFLPVSPSLLSAYLLHSLSSHATFHSSLPSPSSSAAPSLLPRFPPHLSSFRFLSSVFIHFYLPAFYILFSSSISVS